MKLQTSRLVRRFMARLTVAAVACVLVPTFSATAQSEDCFDAGLSPLSLGTPAFGNFTDSFNDGPSGCGSTGNRTQWWSFTPANSGRYLISTCGSAQLDTHLGISLGNQLCEGVATYLACNDDACGAAAQVTVTLIGGNQYRIRVGAFGAPTNGGGYTLLVLDETSTPPANDDCDDAVSASLGVTMGTTRGASGALNLNTCGGSADSNDVYFAFTASNTRRYRFSVCSEQFDAVVSVHSACPASTLQTFQIGSGCATSSNPPMLGCSNRGAVTNVGLNAGQTAFVRVAGAADQSGTGSPFVGFGTFELRIEEVAFARPANDECEDALDLNAEALPFVHAVEGRGAFNDVDPGSCNSGAANEGYFGVWYRYTAPATGILVVSEQSVSDVTIGIWDATACNDLGTSIRCSDNETAVERVTAGRTYFIMVSSFDPTGPTSAYSTRFNFLTTPANDLCVGATDLTGQTFPFAFEVSAFDATNDPSPTPLDPTCNAGLTVNASVYWRFTAPISGGRLTFRETGTDNDVSWAVFTGQCDMPAQVACFTADNNDLNFVDTVPGQNYLIQLSRQPTTPASGRYVGTIDFEQPPANDDCIDAITVTGDFEFRNSLATQTMVPGQATCDGQPADFLKDTWYRYVAPDAGAVSVLALAGSTVRLALYRSPTCVGIDMGFAGCGQGPVFVNIPDLVAGESVYIRIGGVAPGQVFNGQALLTFVPVQGRCCVGASGCVVTTPSLCAAASGTYQGDGTLCNTPDSALEAMFAGDGGAIPDNDAAGRAYVLSVPGAPSDLVGSVRLELEIQHSFVGDLSMTLEKDGRVVVLTNRTRRGLNNAFGSSSDLSGMYTLSDAASSSWWSAATGQVVPPGAYLSSHNGDLVTSINEAFSGLLRGGDWTLRIADNVGSDTGALLGWRLLIAPPDGPSPCGGGTPPCPGDYNGDNTVDLLDLLAFVSDWSSNLGISGMGLPADLNADNTVDLLDLLVFNGDWVANLGLPCP